MQKYGVGALRLRTRSVRLGGVGGNDNKDDSRAPSTMMASIKHSIDQITSSLVGTKKERLSLTSRSNQAKSQKRGVVYMATYYCIAWALTFVPYIIFRIYPEKSSMITVGFLNGLQGLYNFIVYLFPKVRNAKVIGGITWSQAFKKAWTSRGDDAMLSRNSMRASRRIRNIKSTSLSQQPSTYSKSYSSKSQLSIQGASMSSSISRDYKPGLDGHPDRNSTLYKKNEVSFSSNLTNQRNESHLFEQQVEDFLSDDKDKETRKHDKDAVLQRPRSSMMSKQSSKIASFSRRSVTFADTHPSRISKTKEFSSKHSIDVVQECDEEEGIKSEIKLNDGDGM